MIEQITELNGPGVLIQPDTRDARSIRSPGLHLQETFRQRRRRIEQYGAQIRYAAAGADIGKGRSHAAAFEGNLMASETSRGSEQTAAGLGISVHVFRGHTA